MSINEENMIHHNPEANGQHAVGMFLSYDELSELSGIPVENLLDMKANGWITPVEINGHTQEFFASEVLDNMLEIKTAYEQWAERINNENHYRVLFTDANTKQTLADNYYPLTHALIPEDFPAPPEHADYKFTGWSTGKSADGTTIIYTAQYTPVQNIEPEALETETDDIEYDENIEKSEHTDSEADNTPPLSDQPIDEQHEKFDFDASMREVQEKMDKLEEKEAERRAKHADHMKRNRRNMQKALRAAEEERQLKITAARERLRQTAEVEMQAIEARRRQLREHSQTPTTPVNIDFVREKARRKHEAIHIQETQRANYKNSIQQQAVATQNATEATRQYATYITQSNSHPKAEDSSNYQSHIDKIAEYNAKQRQDIMDDSMRRAAGVNALRTNVLEKAMYYQSVYGRTDEKYCEMMAYADTLAHIDTHNAYATASMVLATEYRMHEIYHEMPPEVQKALEPIYERHRPADNAIINDAYRSFPSDTTYTPEQIIQHTYEQSHRYADTSAHVQETTLYSPETFSQTYQNAVIDPTSLAHYDNAPIYSPQSIQDAYVHERTHAEPYRETSHTTDKQDAIREDNRRIEQEREEENRRARTGGLGANHSTEPSTDTDTPQPDYNDTTYSSASEPYAGTAQQDIYPHTETPYDSNRNAEQPKDVSDTPSDTAQHTPPSSTEFHHTDHETSHYEPTLSSEQPVDHTPTSSHTSAPSPTENTHEHSRKSHTHQDEQASSSYSSEAVRRYNEQLAADMQDANARHEQGTGFVTETQTRAPYINEELSARVTESLRTANPEQRQEVIRQYLRDNPNDAHTVIAAYTESEHKRVPEKSSYEIITPILHDNSLSSEQKAQAVYSAYTSTPESQREEYIRHSVEEYKHISNDVATQAAIIAGTMKAVYETCPPDVRATYTSFIYSVTPTDAPPTHQEVLQQAQHIIKVANSLPESYRSEYLSRAMQSYTETVAHQSPDIAQQIHQEAVRHIVTNVNESQRAQYIEATIKGTTSIITSQSEQAQMLKASLKTIIDNASPNKQNEYIQATVAGYTKPSQGEPPAQQQSRIESAIQTAYNIAPADKREAYVIAAASGCTQPNLPTETARQTTQATIMAIQKTVPQDKQAKIITHVVSEQIYRSTPENVQAVLSAQADALKHNNASISNNDLYQAQMRGASADVTDKVTQYQLRESASATNSQLTNSSHIDTVIKAQLTNTPQNKYLSTIQAQMRSAQESQNTTAVVQAQLRHASTQQINTVVAQQLKATTSENRATVIQSQLQATPPAHRQQVIEQQIASSKGRQLQSTITEQLKSVPPEHRAKIIEEQRKVAEAKESKVSQQELAKMQARAQKQIKHNETRHDSSPSKSTADDKNLTNKLKESQDKISKKKSGFTVASPSVADAVVAERTIARATKHHAQQGGAYLATRNKTIQHIAKTSVKISTQTKQILAQQNHNLNRYTKDPLVGEAARKRIATNRMISNALIKVENRIRNRQQGPAGRSNTYARSTHAGHYVSSSKGVRMSRESAKNFAYNVKAKREAMHRKSTKTDGVAHLIDSSLNNISKVHEENKKAKEQAKKQRSQSNRFKTIAIATFLIQLKLNPQQAFSGLAKKAIKHRIKFGASMFGGTNRNLRNLSSAIKTGWQNFNTPVNRANARLALRTARKRANAAIGASIRRTLFMTRSKAAKLDAVQGARAIREYATPAILLYKFLRTGNATHRIDTLNRLANKGPSKHLMRKISRMQNKRHLGLLGELKLKKLQGKTTGISDIRTALIRVGGQNGMFNFHNTRQSRLFSSKLRGTLNKQGLEKVRLKGAWKLNRAAQKGKFQKRLFFGWRNSGKKGKWTALSADDIQNLRALAFTKKIDKLKGKSLKAKGSLKFEVRGLVRKSLHGTDFLAGVDVVMKYKRYAMKGLRAGMKVAKTAWFITRGVGKFAFKTTGLQKAFKKSALGRHRTWRINPENKGVIKNKMRKALKNSRQRITGAINKRLARTPAGRFAQRMGNKFKKTFNKATKGVKKLINPIKAFKEGIAKVTHAFSAVLYKIAFFGILFVIAISAISFVCYTIGGAADSLLGWTIRKDPDGNPIIDEEPVETVDSIYKKIADALAARDEAWLKEFDSYASKTPAQTFDSATYQTLVDSGQLNGYYDPIEDKVHVIDSWGYDVIIDNAGDDTHEGENTTHIAGVYTEFVDGVYNPIPYRSNAKAILSLVAARFDGNITKHANWLYDYAVNDTDGQFLWIKYGHQSLWTVTHKELGKYVSTGDPIICPGCGEFTYYCDQEHSLIDHGHWVYGMDRFSEMYYGKENEHPATPIVEVDGYPITYDARGCEHCMNSNGRTIMGSNEDLSASDYHYHSLTDLSSCNHKVNVQFTVDGKTYTCQVCGGHAGKTSDGVWHECQHQAQREVSGKVRAVKYKDADGVWHNIQTTVEPYQEWYCPGHCSGHTIHYCHGHRTLTIRATVRGLDNVCCSVDKDGNPLDADMPMFEDAGSKPPVWGNDHREMYYDYNGDEVWNCPNCDMKYITAERTTCPQCGYEFNPSIDSTFKLWNHNISIFMDDEYTDCMLSPSDPYDVKEFEDENEAENAEDNDKAYAIKHWDREHVHRALEYYNQDWYETYGVRLANTQENGDAGSFAIEPITEAEIQEILNSLPSDTAEYRKALIEYALHSVGKIPYYFGGYARHAGYEDRPAVAKDGQYHNFGDFVSVGDTVEKDRHFAGLDCSHWTCWCFWSYPFSGQYLRPGLPANLGNISTFGLKAIGKAVSRDDLKPGDLLVDNDGTKGHVAIFIRWENPEHTKITFVHETGGKYNCVTLSMESNRAHWDYYRRVFND